MKFKKGETVCTQGFHAVHFIKIKSGIVKEYINYRLYKVTSEGEFLTLHNDLSHGTYYVTTAICLTDTEVEFCANLSVNHLFQQREYAFKLIDIRKKSCLGKICEIAMLHEGLKLTREDIADLADCSKEVAIRCIGELKDAGFISRDKVFKILNIVEIEKLIAQETDKII